MDGPARDEGPLLGRDDEPRVVDYRLAGLAESVLLVPLPADRLRGLVPARYRLVEQPAGTATLVAAFGSVGELTVGPGDARPAVVSEYGVVVDSPDGSPERHAYLLWQLSDDATLVARMRALGLPAHHARTDFTATSTDGAVTIAAQTLWEGSPNRMRAAATEPRRDRGASQPGVRFWHDGPRGTVRVAYECPDCPPRTAATGTVAATAGSRLDDALDGERPGAGFFIRADLVARAELVSR